MLGTRYLSGLSPAGFVLVIYPG
ncbi:hypothetical protein F383_39155 [Gossypium arboreum]|uniref:Uncharacterized protein n=1 Tax=Gossypium arboreum TaxID=29729 RepID=A0A0B0MKW2_GOSAR|nr:hypothetical protein F383_39155 [Gossypium arboreum]